MGNTGIVGRPGIRAEKLEVYAKGCETQNTGNQSGYRKKQGKAQRDSQQGGIAKVIQRFDVA